ncbi:MAG: hypothetical protein NC344_04025 [Bacteroidales bacterium]|nr:hypothetical protein [Bacteroidales bacterium]MCM1146996.1 hypothetical protein [Bacteroidales bacterium]MCM1205871.1 hypothetical protein [Bacillota bacterium]MCM1509888.1 hypothetical protein [Clostridium sp.]
MKKTLILTVISAMIFSSCSTVVKTASTAETTSSIENATVADLDVAPERITYTVSPSKAVQRGGMANVKRAVESEALTANGNADVLVEPQYIIEKKKSLFGSKVTSVTVTGRPAKYRNFRSLNDSVWSNPAFRGLAPVVVRKSGKALQSLKTREASGTFGAYALRRTGFSAILNISGGYTGYDDPWQSVDQGYLRATLTFGWQITPNVFAGIGVGADHNCGEHELFIPVFAEGRYYFSPRRTSWFFGLKAGANINSGYYDSGLFISPALGYSFGKFEVALEYSMQTSGQTHYMGRYEGNIEHDYTFSNIGISLGIKF